jgi:hypothetical protein
MEQVAEFYSNTVPPSVFAGILNQIGMYYNTATLVVENNSIGSAVLNSLSNDMGYENVYYESKKSSFKLGIKMTPSNRPVILEAMQNRLMNGSVRINSQRLVGELKTFIYSPQKKRAEAIKGKHDDAIMALSLAIFVREERMRGMPTNSASPVSFGPDKESYEDIKREIVDGGISDWFEIKSDKKDFGDYGENLDKRNPIFKEFGW